MAGARIVVQAFYAVQDTKTPVRSAFFSLIVNIVGNWLLMYPLKQGGIAFATSIAAAVNFFQLLYICQKRFGSMDWSVFKDSLMRIGVQSLAMGSASIIFLKLFRFSEHTHLTMQAVALFGTIGLSLLIYFAVALILKSKELIALRESFAHKPTFNELAAANVSEADVE